MNNLQNIILDSLNNDKATVFLWKRTGKNFHLPFPVIYKINKTTKNEITISPRDALYQDKFPKATLSWNDINAEVDKNDSSLWLLIDGLRYNSNGLLEEENKEEVNFKL